PHGAVVELPQDRVRETLRPDRPAVPGDEDLVPERVPGERRLENIVGVVRVHGENLVPTLELQVQTRGNRLVRGALEIFSVRLSPSIHIRLYRNDRRL